MVEFAGKTVSDRKLRLFSVGCCRLIWMLIPARQCKEAVGVAEAYADRQATKKTMTRARIASRVVVSKEENYWKRHAANVCLNAVNANVILGARRAADHALGAALCHGTDESNHVSIEVLLALLRDVVGPLPFRTIAMVPEWLTSTVTDLARTIYESRDFGAMPILADALQDADCDNDEILDHCRGPGPHVRGCWVVDLILGKE